MISESALFRQFKKMLDSSVAPEEKAALVDHLRLQTGGNGLGQVLDRLLLEEVEKSQKALRISQKTILDLEELLEKATAPPYHPATFLGLLDLDGEIKGEVRHGNSRFFISLAEGVDTSTLRLGEEVLLNSHLNLLLRPSPAPPPRHGETAIFDGVTEDGLIVLEYRDEKLLFLPSARLCAGDLKKGDRVRADRALGIAFEKVEYRSDTRLFLENTPTDTFDMLGGLEEQIEELKRLITLPRDHRELTGLYGLVPYRGIILAGPSGTGKTKLARCLANYAASCSSRGCSLFMHNKPGEDKSMWYGQTESNIRERFRIAREAAQRDPEVPVIIFMDEVECIGGVRDSSLSRINDRVIQAYMAELDGLEERGNIIVIGATNRPESLDPALLRPGRFGDRIIQVPRPNLRAARAILELYLPEGIPYAGADGPDRARREIIEGSLAALFAPNAEIAVAAVRFRDQRRVQVKRSDLLSGAVIQKVTQEAKMSAVLRHIRYGEEGLRIEDVLRAVENEYRDLGRLLTPANCRGYLPDLPQDSDVTAVEPVVRPMAGTHDYVVRSLS